MRSYSAITRTAGTTLDVLLEHGQNFVEGTVAAVAPNYFDVLGPRVIAGRTFLPSDAPGEPIVLSDAAALELFPRGEPAVGAVVTIDHTPHTVIGVVSHQSNFPHEHTMAWTAAPGQCARVLRAFDAFAPRGDTGRRRA